MLVRKGLLSLGIILFGIFKRQPHLLFYFKTFEEDLWPSFIGSNVSGF
jgi:hypothetical protein